jgi:hypothetical protein
MGWVAAGSMDLSLKKGSAEASRIVRHLPRLEEASLLESMVHKEFEDYIHNPHGTSLRDLRYMPSFKINIKK